MCGIDYLKNYLTDNGFKWREEGEIFQFSYHELTCVVPVDTTDAVRIFVMFGTEEDDISLLSEVCNDINKLLFLVKCFIHNEKLFFTLYFSTLDINTTVSTCFVRGNRSAGCTFWGR